MAFLVVLAMVDESGVLAICSPFAAQLTAPAVAPLNLVSSPLAHDCLGSVHGICHGVQTTRYSPWHVLGGLAHGSCCDARIKALLAICILVEALITALARHLNRYIARHWQTLGCLALLLSGDRIEMSLPWHWIIGSLLDSLSGDGIETSSPWHWIIGSLLASFSRYCSRILFSTSSLKYVGFYFVFDALIFARVFTTI